MLNPMLIEALGSLVRTGLAALAGYLVNAGIWSAADATKYVAAGSLALITLGWSLWQKYGSRLKFVTALAADKKMTERQVEKLVAKGATPSVSTSKAAVPTVTG